MEKTKEPWFCYLWEKRSSSASSSSRIPVRFLFRYTGGRLMCLRCAFITRHEYGADSSSEAAANDGTAHGTATASPPGAEDTPAGWTGAPAADTSPDMFTCFGSSSACSRFAILFEKNGRVTTEHFRFEKGSSQPVVMSSCRRLPVRRRTTGRTHLTVQGVTAHLQTY